MSSGTPSVETSLNAARREAATECAWCGDAITRKARGRIPEWCSPPCRQRAWEQRRAAASGRSAIEIVERHIPIPVTAPEPRHAEWNAHLRRFATQLDDGSVYRDLRALAQSLNEVIAAFTRRTDNRGRR
jgi:hypothetical protein